MTAFWLPGASSDLVARNWGLGGGGGGSRAPTGPSHRGPGPEARLCRDRPFCLGTSSRLRALTHSATQTA